MRHWDKHIEEHNVFLQSNKLLVLPGEALTHTSEPATLFLVMCLYKQQPFHCNLTIDISSVFDKQSKIRSYTLEKLNVLVHKEPPGERKKNPLKHLISLITSRTGLLNQRESRGFISVSFHLAFINSHAAFLHFLPI